MLAVGTSFPYAPFEYRKGGELTGFDVELLDDIADRLGVETEWVNIPFDSMFTSLRAGRFDAAAAAFAGCATDIAPSSFQETVQQRQAVVAMTDPYYVNEYALFVMEGSDSGITSEDDIGDGDRVGVLKGTVTVDYSEEQYAPNGAETVVFQGLPDMALALEAGSIDVGLEDVATVRELAETKPIEILETFPGGLKYTFAVGKENTALLDAINEQLAALIEDGTYAKLHEKYFPGQRVPDPAELSEC